MPHKAKLNTQEEIECFFGGKKINLLTPIKEAQRTKSYREFIFICDCGTEVIAGISTVKRGGTKSCGCHRRDGCIERSTKHGKAHLPEYQIWAGIKTRVTNKNRHGSEQDYVLRGIGMSKLWFNNFDKFYEDMGPRPTPNHSIERIDNNKGYFKSNCKWATSKEQGRNKRNNLLLTYRGQTKCVAEWSEITGINQDCLESRFHRWGNVERVISQPVKNKKRP